VSVAIHCDAFSISMERGPDIRDITRELQRILKQAAVEDGTMHVTAVGSTGSVTSIEYERGVVQDLKRAISELAPPEREYEHEKAWHDGNGHSHVQAALLGPSIVLPVRSGRLALGTWQQVVLVNHDVRARQRRVEVTVLGL
jgi:secondary thiamine-phosphate synthase enzyme